MNLSKYKTIIFDCDGVILNSNKIKTNAFYLAALPYGEGAAKELVEYHVLHGGVSRYKKFDHFLSVIVPRHCTEDQSPSRHGFSTVLEKLLDEYAGIVTKELLACEIAEGLVELREEKLASKWLWHREGIKPSCGLSLGPGGSRIILTQAFLVARIPKRRSLNGKRARAT